MNYGIFFVKILRPPEQSFFEDDTSLTEVWVQFSRCTYSKKTYYGNFKISAWGDIAYDLSKFYNVNDYLMIEGVLSFTPNYANNYYRKNDKQINFTVRKLFPVFLKNFNNENLKFNKKTPLPF